MVKVASRELIPMKLSFLRKVIPLFVVFPTMLQPALAWENRGGYWKEGYWCDQTNNYCGKINRRYNHYNQSRLESIEYNGIIIRTGIRPNSDICSLVIQILGHCDGFIRFDENTRTHIFSNHSHQQYYQNNQSSGDGSYYNTPHPNQCVVNILGVGLICPQVW